MTTPELIQYVKNEVAKGTTREVISGKLKMQGWTDLDVLEVFNIINQPSPESVHPVQSPVTPNVSPMQPSSPAVSSALSQLTSLSEQSLHLQNTNPTVNPTANTMNPISGINTMQMQSSLTQPKSGKKFLKYFVVIIVFLILFIGGALVYASGFFLSTTNMLSQITDSSKNNKTFKFDFNLNIDASNMKIPVEKDGIMGDVKTADINMAGAFDMNDTNNTKFDSSYAVKMGKIDAGINVRALDGTLYLNLTKAPDLGFFSLKPFENRWVSIPMKNKDGQLDTANPLLSASPVKSDFINNLTDEQKQHITDIVKKANFIKITKKHLPEIVDGSLSYHIGYSIDKVGLVSFMTELTDYMKSLDKSNDSLSAVQSADISKSLEAINDLNGELWIGVFDKLPHKMTINMTVINPEKKEDGSAKVAATLVYKDWNKPVTVEVPSKVVTVEELMKEIFGGVANNTQVNVTPSEGLVSPTSSGNIVGSNTESSNVVVSNPVSPDIHTSPTPGVKLTQDDLKKEGIMDSIKAQAKIYFDLNKSYKGFCSSKVQNGAYQFAITLPKDSIYKCNDFGNSWVSWVKLSNSRYLCVDDIITSIDTIPLDAQTKSCPIR